MAIRGDGIETRKRLLNAACEVFAAKGFREAKVADICKQASANVASVNYYFGDKAALYREAWQHALQQFEKIESIELTAASPRERLREYIANIIRYFAAQDKLGYLTRLYQMEMLNPTGLIQETLHLQMRTRQQKMRDLIRDVVGPEADDLCIRFCQLSIIGQCRTFVTFKREDIENMLAQRLTPAVMRRLTDHIVDFSLAGILSAGRRRPGQAI